MSRAIQKASLFIADFQNLFSWYVKAAGPELAWRFQSALDVTLAKLSIRPDLGRPKVKRITFFPGGATFWKYFDFLSRK